MFKKLDKMLERYDKLNELVSDNEVIAKISEWRAYTKELSDMTETVDKYLEYNYSGELVGSYLYNPEEKIFVTYDSIEVVTAKYEYADSMKGMGIMCWAYTEDTSDNFINAIYDSMHK